MEHISDIQMLEMLGGHIPESEQLRFRDHIGDCSECRQRWQEYEQTWMDLAECQVDTAGHDLVENMISALPAENPPMKLWPATALARIAASILLAVFLGHVLGKWSAPQPAPPEETAVTQAMFLDALGPESVVGWSAPVRAEDSEEGSTADETVS